MRRISRRAFASVVLTGATASLYPQTKPSSSPVEIEERYKRIEANLALVERSLRRSEERFKRIDPGSDFAKTDARIAETRERICSRAAAQVETDKKIKELLTELTELKRRILARNGA